MIEPLTDLPAGVIGFEAVGEVTPDDYKDVLLPAIDEAAKRGKIRFVFVHGPHHNGFSPATAWERAKLRIEHYGDWERCAIVTDVAWLQPVVSMFQWMMPGTLKLFPLAELEAAKAWAAG